MTKNASAFLSPIYGDRLDTARYHGVVEDDRNKGIHTLYLLILDFAALITVRT